MWRLLGRLWVVSEPQKDPTTVKQMNGYILCAVVCWTLPPQLLVFAVCTYWLYWIASSNDRGRGGRYKWAFLYRCSWNMTFIISPYIDSDGFSRYLFLGRIEKSNRCPGGGGCNGIFPTCRCFQGATEYSFPPSMVEWYDWLFSLIRFCIQPPPPPLPHF